jgi:alkanesulfonate monooxygenase SsuD/methylene tetrahydromethanopterin reductase-like flavin-dependent oxidoreductase (luciferase family)
MEFGIIPNQYLDSRFGSQFGYEDMLEQAELADQLPYDTVVVGERHFWDDGVLDLRTCMPALGMRTETLDVMSNIMILPPRHPIRVAEDIANLDQLTGGRTRWGISLGYRESELINFGVDPDERVSRFMESVHLIKRLLDGDRFDHDGKHFQFEDGFVAPGPVQSPRPPLVGGGSADTAIKRAAYRCDGFTAAITDPDQLERDIELYYDALAEAGRDPEDGHVAMFVDGYCGATTEEAFDAVDPYLLDLHEQYIKWGNPEFDDVRPTFDDVKDQLLIGTPAEVAEQVERYREIGVDHICYRSQFPGQSQESQLESIRRFGEEVIPQFT